MNRKLLLSFWLPAFILSGAAAAQSAEYNGRFSHPSGATLAPDRIIVKWRASASIASAKQAPATAEINAIPALAGMHVQSVTQIAPRLQLLRLEQPLSAADLQQTLERLSADPGVEYAVPDRRRWPHLVPSDSLFTTQWYLQSAQLSGIRASTAWDTTTGSAGTVIAVLDTGVRFNHPDLGHAEQGGKLLAGYDFIAGESATSFLVANDGDGRDSDPSDPGDWIDAGDQQNAEFSSCPVSDSSWHGTRVAGIIGAATNNGIGMAGITWNAWILPVRVLGKCGGFDSDIMAGMRWAAGLSVSGVPDNPHPANIINMSLGADGACNAAYADVINELTARGVVVMASAGNDGTFIDSPANCAGVMAVVGLRQAGTKVGFSSLGLDAGIGAPGGNCVNIGAGQPCLFSINTTSDVGRTAPAGPTYTDQFNFSVGTSFSSPIVAGAAGLMHAVNARLPPALVIARLKQSAAPFPSTSNSTPAPPVCHVPANSSDVQTAECICTTQTCGAGMLDAFAAVGAAQRPIAFVNVPASVSAGQTISLDGQPSAAACNRTLSTFSWSVSTASGTPPTINNPDQAVASVQVPTSGDFVLRLTVTDSNGAQDTADVAVTSMAAVTTATAPLSGAACPPIITIAQTGPPPVTPSGGKHGGGGMMLFDLLALSLGLLRRITTRR
ncbi:MAG TPA: S8 family serine peptidase [Steroidobacteraceae bacterium]|nr:S8 family serine peptidase [Steroidobacteraceae bacterium]